VHCSHRRERPASECADPYGDGQLQLQVRVSSVVFARCPWCRCVSQRTLRARWRQARPQRCGVRRRRQLHAVGRRPARRHRVAPAWCLLRGGLPRSSAASVLAHSALGVDRMSRLAAHSYGNLCAHALTGVGGRCGAAAAVIGRTPPAVGPQRTRQGSGSRRTMRHAQVRKCGRSPLRLEGLRTHACMRALAHTRARTHTHLHAKQANKQTNKQANKQTN
jgi:hypothetical protein